MPCIPTVLLNSGSSTRSGILWFTYKHVFEKEGIITGMEMWVGMCIVIGRTIRKGWSKNLGTLESIKITLVVLLKENNPQRFERIHANRIWCQENIQCRGLQHATQNYSQLRCSRKLVQIMLFYNMKQTKSWRPRLLYYVRNFMETKTHIWLAIRCVNPR